MSALKRYGGVALVAIVSASLAVGVAQFALPHSDPKGADLNTLLHGEMHLSSDQQQKMDALEQNFAHDRKDLDRKLHDANSAIAAAYLSEHRYGPRVSEAIDRSHVAMGELQKLTLRHVFAMRAVLTPEQAAVFDQEVNRALTRTAGR